MRIGVGVSRQGIDKDEPLVHGIMLPSKFVHPLALCGVQVAAHRIDPFAARSGVSHTCPTCWTRFLELHTQYGVK